MRDFILADNQELTRLGLKALLSEYTDTTVTIVEDKAALIERLRHDSHTVVVIDYTLFDFTDEDNLLIVVDRFPEAMWLLISDDLNHATVKKFLYSSKRISIVFKDTPIWNLNTSHTFRLARHLTIEPGLGIDNIFNQVDRRIYWANRRYANFSSGTAVVFQTKVRF